MDWEKNSEFIHKYKWSSPNSVTNWEKLSKHQTVADLQRRVGCFSKVDIRLPGEHVDVEPGSGSNHSLRTLASHSFEIPADRLKLVVFFWVSSIESPLDQNFCHQKYRFMIYIPNLLGLIQSCDKIIKNNKNNKKITWPSPWDCLDSETYFKFVAQYGMFIFSNVSKVQKILQQIIATHPLGGPNV